MPTLRRSIAIALVALVVVLFLVTPSTVPVHAALAGLLTVAWFTWRGTSSRAG